MKEDMVILIAEDDAGHFQLIKKNLWLTYVDGDIIRFKNGQEVLDFLFKPDNEVASGRNASNAVRHSATAVHSEYRIPDSEKNREGRAPPSF